MKFFRLDLLTLLISLFILSSCKNQDTIGLGVDASNQLNGTLIDTSTIVAHTVLEDSVVTSGPLGKTPLAYFKDPVFGTTESNIASDLNLPASAAYTLPAGIITIDSVRLVMKYADGFYGDSLTSQYKINVYQLNERFNPSTTYYNNKTWDYNSSALLGSLTFRPFTHTRPRIYDILVGKTDTLKKVAPQVRIPIDPSFINNNFFNAGSIALGSNNVFIHNIKGLYITLDKTGSTGAGGAIMMAPSDSLAVYYRAQNGSTVDTAAAYLPLNHFAAQIKHTYTTTIQTELNSAPGSRNTIYLQGLAGLRAKISFPYIKNIVASLGNVVLNRVELVIDPTPGTDIPYAPLPKLTMYRYDIANQRGYVEDAVSTDPRSGGANVVSQFGGFYDKTRHQYHFVITAYIQDLMLNKTTDYGTYIAPADTTNKSTVDIAGTPQVAARTVAVGTDKTSPYRMKLNIIYTKIK